MNFKDEKMERVQIDDKLKRLVESELPKAPDDEWFVRRTMNRLPCKVHSPGMGIMQKMCYALGCVLALAGWVVALSYTMQHGLTLNAIIMAVAIPSITMFCICAMAMPAIKRALWF